MTRLCHNIGIEHMIPNKADGNKDQGGRKTMALQLRRVVTGHDANGRAVVKIDEVSKNLVSGRPGATP
jgi:hypothetical protein